MREYTIRATLYTMRQYLYPAPSTTLEHHAYLIWQMDQLPRPIGSEATREIAWAQYLHTVQMAGKAYKAATGMNTKDRNEYAKVEAALAAFYAQFPNENTPENKAKASKLLKEYANA